MHKSLLTEHVWIIEGTYLFVLPGIAMWARLLTSSLGPSPQQEPAVYADENDARCNLIYMNM